jgi:hypothetical protein
MTHQEIEQYGCHKIIMGAGRGLGAKMLKILIDYFCRLDRWISQSWYP